MHPPWATMTEPEHYKSATGSEPAHSNQHVLNTRRQLRYSHPWYYSGVKCTASGSNPHPLAHAHAFTCCDSSGWGFRWRFCRFHNSKVVRLCLATLHSTRELWFCWELTSAFYQDMRNNQDIHDTNSPANDLDSSKQPEGSRKQHSLSYCGTMVSQKYPQSYHTSPCRPTYLGALLLMSGHTTPKGRTHQPDKQLWVQTLHNCHTTPSNHAQHICFQ
jgi:hypothetical protein